MRRSSRSNERKSDDCGNQIGGRMAAGMQRMSRADGWGGVWELLSEVRTHRDKSECDARWCSGADIGCGEMGLIAENQRDVGFAGL